LLGTYWLNQFAVRKELEPRRRELETLLAETGNAAVKSETKKSNHENSDLVCRLAGCRSDSGVIIASIRRCPPPSKPPLEVIRKKYDLPALAVVVVKERTDLRPRRRGRTEVGYATPVTTNDVFPLVLAPSPYGHAHGILIEEAN